MQSPKRVWCWDTDMNNATVTKIFHLASDVCDQCKGQNEWCWDFDMNNVTITKRVPGTSTMFQAIVETFLVVR